MIVALVADDLRPAVGTEVALHATWAGSWPAYFAWSGTTRDDGLDAVARPVAPGRHEVRAGGVALTLDVQPAANRGAPTPILPVAVPLHDVEAGGCRDDRFPALAGAWVAWCSGAAGVVDRATHLESRVTVTLAGGGVSPGLGDGTLYDPAQGLWRLPASQADRSVPRLPSSVAPPATDGVHAALALADHVQLFALTDTRRPHTEATPLPGSPLGMAWPYAAWIAGDPLTGRDVWVAHEGTARPLARSPADERHVAGDGRWLAWATDGAVAVEDVGRGERRSYEADTGFYGGLALWGPVACWEDRGALRAGNGDVDLRCSDGVEVRRAGHQLHPSRHGPWLIFREQGKVFLATVPELVLDDDDPRAVGEGATVDGGWRGAHREGGVRYAFHWPASGWRVERWIDGAWVAGEALGVGAVSVEHPGGDAIRLVPS